MTVAVAEFVNEMERLWTHTLNNESNEGFRTVWQRMAETYAEAIAAHPKTWFWQGLMIPPGWLVIAPEMGVGKTVGACLYLGMMSRPLKDVSAPTAHGGIFVCRTIKQCEEAVRRINEHAGYAAAVTKHSENSITLDEVNDYPVLVITHAALVNPDDEARKQLVSRYISWKRGRRKLVIIDEALANAVEFHTVTERSLYRLLGQVPPQLREKHDLAYDILDSLLRHIQSIAKDHSEMYSMWDKAPHGSSSYQELAVKLPKLFDRLLHDLRLFKRGERRTDWNDKEVRDAEVDEVKTTLNAVAAVFRHWTLFVKKGAEGGMLSARLLLPDLWCPVLLNATANQDVLLDHIAATIVPMPKVRNYRNLTLRILRSKGIGKEMMAKNAVERFQRLGKFIRHEAEEGDSWLVVTHKGAEDIARLHLPVGLGATAHWGALDGLNDFRDCNKLVLFGLSYRDPTWSSALYFALRGKQQPNAWFKSASAKEIKYGLESKSMAGQILQALGRPRSRHVSDDQGNCLPTTAYLTLPDDSLGREIERHIADELPGVVIEPWNYRLDGEFVDSAEPASLAAAVVTHMRNRPPGKYTVSEIAIDLDLTNEQKNALKDGLKKRRKVYHDLIAVGVAYVVEGKRRGAKSYLVKRK